MTYPTTQQFKEIGYQYNKNIPSIIIGNPNPKKPIKYKPIGEDEYNKELWYRKIEYWIFMIIVSIVLGYAGLRLIDTFIK